MLLASILDDWAQCGNRSTSIQRKASGGEIRSTTTCFQRRREGMSIVADFIPYIRQALRQEKPETKMELEEAIEQTESRHMPVVDKLVVDLKEQGKNVSDQQENLDGQEEKFKGTLAEFKREFMLDMQRMFSPKSQSLHALPSPVDESHTTMTSAEGTDPTEGMPSCHTRE